MFASIALRAIFEFDAAFLPLTCKTYWKEYKQFITGKDLMERVIQYDDPVAAFLLHRHGYSYEMGLEFMKNGCIRASKLIWNLHGFNNFYLQEARWHYKKYMQNYWPIVKEMYKHFGRHMDSRILSHALEQEDFDFMDKHFQRHFTVYDVAHSGSVKILKKYLQRHRIPDVMPDLSLVIKSAKSLDMVKYLIEECKVDGNEFTSSMHHMRIFSGEILKYLKDAGYTFILDANYDYKNQILENDRLFIQLALTGTVTFHSTSPFMGRLMKIADSEIVQMIHDAGYDLGLLMNIAIWMDSVEFLRGAEKLGYELPDRWQILDAVHHQTLMRAVNGKIRNWLLERYGNDMCDSIHPGRSCPGYLFEHIPNLHFLRKVLRNERKGFKPFLSFKRHFFGEGSHLLMREFMQFPESLEDMELLMSCVEEQDRPRVRGLMLTHSLLESEFKCANWLFKPGMVNELPNEIMKDIIRKAAPLELVKKMYQDRWFSTWLLAESLPCRRPEVASWIVLQVRKNQTIMRRLSGFNQECRDQILYWSVRMDQL